MRLLILLALALNLTTQKGEPDTVVILGQDVATTPADLESYLIKEIDDIAAYQEKNKSVSGQYVQILPLFRSDPVNGVVAFPDSLDTKPTDGDFGLSLFNDLGEVGLPYNLRVDVYDGPQGKGYVINATVNFYSATYQRTINVGPETYRDSNWSVTQP